LNAICKNGFYSCTAKINVCVNVITNIDMIATTLLTTTPNIRMKNGKCRKTEINIAW
jgi:hypothetical protein